MWDCFPFTMIACWSCQPHHGSILSSLPRRPRALTNRPVQMLDHLHRTHTHRRRQGLQPVRLPKRPANGQKGTQGSPVAKFQMPIRTKGNSASLGNRLLRQIQLKTHLFKRLSNFAQHMINNFTIHNCLFYGNRMRIFYSIIIFVPIVQGKLKRDALRRVRIHWESADGTEAVPPSYRTISSTPALRRIFVKSAYPSPE